MAVGCRNSGLAVLVSLDPTERCSMELLRWHRCRPAAVDFWYRWLDGGVAVMVDWWCKWRTGAGSVVESAAICWVARLGTDPLRETRRWSLGDLGGVSNLELRGLLWMAINLFLIFFYCEQPVGNNIKKTTFCAHCSQHNAIKHPAGTVKRNAFFVCRCKRISSHWQPSSGEKSVTIEPLANMAARMFVNKTCDRLCVRV